MNLTLALVGVCVGGLAVYVLLHAAVSRLLVPRRRWMATRNLFLIVAPLVMATGAWVTARHLSDGSAVQWVAADLAACLLVMLLIHVGYLTFYAFIDRSITLRTFIEIQEAGEKGLTFAQLAAKYDTRGAYHRRLAILCQSGYLAREGAAPGGAYRLQKKGLVVGSLVRFLKSFYKVGPGG